MFRAIKVLRVAVLGAAVACGGVQAVRAQGGEVIKTVVIDPGHGGKDAGACWGNYREKDIVLDVALRLGRLIKEKYPSVKVVYTRSTDVFIELDERGRVANRNSADLFLSIHVNSTKKSGSASGTETFIMGTTKGAANLEVAMRENDVIKMESDPLTKYQGYEPGSPESFIMFNLMQYSHREQSLELARAVQQQYCSTVKLPDRGVKEAGFLVLWRTAMPAILTELGFINHSTDIKQLTSDAGKERYARCLFNAFSAYKTKTEGAGDRIVLEDAGDDVPPSEAIRQEPVASGPVPTAAEPAKMQSGVTFAVQIRISPKSLNANDPCFGAWRGKVSEKKIGQYYKYFVGECASYRDAVAKQAEVRRTVKDAFVVAFLDGEPVKVADALKMQR